MRAHKIDRNIGFLRRWFLLFFFGTTIFCWGGGFAARASDEWWDDARYHTIIREDTVWSGTVSVDKPTVIIDGATLEIEKGTRVELTEDILVLDGTIQAEGTEHERIVFAKGPGRDISEYSEAHQKCFTYGHGLRFSDASNGRNAPSILRYAIVESLGVDIAYDDDLCLRVFLPESEKKSWWNEWFVSTAFATHWTVRQVPAVFYESGRVRIENTIFRENAYADIETYMYFDDEQTYSDNLVVVNSDFSGISDTNALFSDIKYDGEQKTKADFLNRVLLKNNWYGNENGPSGEQFEEDDLTRGRAVDGDVTVDGWRKNDLIVDPVIVVPGIMGSSEVSGKWVLDPIAHTYDNLVESFEENGYVSGRNLFTFPYDWKRDNAVSAMLLAGKIAEVKKETGMSRVDVVAHSMGGLVSRAYIAGMENAEYGNDIDQLITLGTPQRGSPKSYFQWEAGEGFFSWEDALIKHHIEQQAEEAGYNDNLFRYIREKVPSVEELLPDYDYLYDTTAQKMRSYPTGYPINAFLEELNDEKSMRALEPIRFTNIYGKTEKSKLTLEKIRVGDAGDDGKWKDGMPENFGNTKTDQGLEYGEGDVTVPLSSAKGIVADETKEVSSTHTDLPTKAQCEAVRTLTGRDTCSYVDKTRITNVLLFKVFSPVDIQVLSPDGMVLIGKDFETGKLINNTENKLGFYSGWDGVASEFIAIPNAKNGVYTVRTQGTGSGAYRVEAVKISEDASGKTAESTTKITGTAKPGVIEEQTVTVTDDAAVTDASDTTETTKTPVAATIRAAVSDEKSTESKETKKSNSEDDEDHNEERDDTKSGEKKSIPSALSLFGQREADSPFPLFSSDEMGQSSVEGAHASKEETVSETTPESKTKRSGIWLVWGACILLGFGLLGRFWHKRFRQ